MAEKVIFLYLFIVMIICGGCNGGEVHEVGDSSGWTSTNITPSHYKSWAASKVFHVGDTLLFEYNKEFHNVVRVTHTNFNSCNSTGAYATWASGNDSFTITKPGHYYFICSFPGHCWAGQKVDIRVLEHHGHGPARSPSHLGPSAPTSPESWQPQPSGPPPTALPSAHHHKCASSSLHSSWLLWVLLLAMAMGLPAIVFFAFFS